MAKGLRSKVKRRNRTEFRNTIGKEAHEKQMELVQSKLQQCIDKGSSLTSNIERLSHVFDPNSSSDGDDSGADEHMEITVENDIDEDGDEPMTSHRSKSPKQIPHKRDSTKSKRKKKLIVDMAVGQSGAKLARKKISKMNKRGQLKYGQRILKSSTTKKKKNDTK